MAYETSGFFLLTELISDDRAEELYGVGTVAGNVLGNTEIGDGAKFKGRGLIMLTGRYNYQRYGDLIGVDLIKIPELAAEPDNAWFIAVLFWTVKGLNELADVDDIEGITKKINGGLGGLEGRKKWFERFE